MSHFEWAILMEQEYRQLGSGLRHDIHVGDHVSYTRDDGKILSGLVTFVRCDNYLEVWFGEMGKYVGSGEPMICQMHIHHENLRVSHKAPSVASDKKLKPKGKKKTTKS